MFIPHSELILNADGSIYHLGLSPGDLAERIITVGDPGRIELLRPYFSKVELEVRNREFCSMTGVLNGKRISVISTGIGTDNIDIVLNEVDALFNIDFDTRKEKNQKTVLEFVRIGTSGTIREDIEVNDVILSHTAVGLDGMMLYYPSESSRNIRLENYLNHAYHAFPIPIYAADGDPGLLRLFDALGTRGITLTTTGFYAPQSRQIRGNMMIDIPEVFNKLSYQGMKFTNIEMETAGIYGLCALLGHRSVSLNLILANRATGVFSDQPGKAMNRFVDSIMQIL